MKEKNAFIKFVSGKRCRETEFAAAYHYYEKASISERKLFYKEIMLLVKTTLLKLREHRASDIHTIISVISPHGIPESYFRILLTKDNYQPGNEDRNIFLEAKKYEWKKNRMLEIAKYYHLPLNKLMDLIEDYAWHNLGLDKACFHKYQKTYQAFQKFILEKAVRTVFDDACFYYLYYADSQEKKMFADYGRKLIYQVLKDDGTSSFKENDYDLYVLADLIGINADVKLQIIKRFKKYYDLAKLGDFNSTYIGEQTKKLNLPRKTLENLIIIYAQEILGINDMDKIIADKKKQSQCDTRLFVQLDKVIITFDKELVKKLIESQNISAFITNYCHVYHANTPGFNKEQVEKFLRKCFQENIAENKVAMNTPTIKPSQPIGLASKNETKNQNELTSTCQEILTYIQTGINSTQGKRPFSLIDYFLLYQDKPVHRCCLTGLDFTLEEKKALKRFFHPITTANIITFDNAMQINYEFNSLKDKKGFPIKGTGLVLTEAEKRGVIQFLTDNKIPLYDILVVIAMRLYAHNSLEINLQEETPTLK